MDETRKIVATLCGGGYSNVGFDNLCRAINIARGTVDKPPFRLEIYKICKQIADEKGSSEKTVYRSIARMTDNIWNNCDMEQLKSILEYDVVVKMRPKDLVYDLARHMELRKEA